ncbi:MAG: sensor domain-containing protein [Rubrobacteraceae bacterium]
MSEDRAVASGDREAAGGPGSRLWLAYLAVGILASIVYFFLDGVARDTLYYGVGVSASGAIFFGVRRWRPSCPVAWYLIIAGLLAWVVGDVTFGFYEHVLDIEAPYPSVADAIYLGAYPLICGGLFLMIRARANRRDRTALLDTAILATGLGVLAYEFLMSPYLEDFSLPVLDRLVSAAYPFMDFLVIAVVVRLAFTPELRSKANYLLFGAAALYLAADVVYAEAALRGAYSSGDPIDAGWLLSYLLFGATALHPAMHTLTEPSPARTARLTRLRLALLIATVLALPLTLVVRELDRPDGGSLVIIGGTVVIFLLVLVRMDGLVRSSEAVSLRYERAASRARFLKEAAAFAAAPDLAAIRAAALDAVLGLAGGEPNTRAGFATGSAESMTVTASAGVRAEEIENLSLDPRRLPEPQLAKFLAREPIEAEGEEAARLREALGLRPDPRPFFVLPLFVREEPRGAILVASDRAVSGEIRSGLESLGSQVALALEGAELAEEGFRRKSEARFRSLIQNSSDIITVVDVRGDIFYQSPSIEQVLGFTPEESLGQNILRSALIHPDDLAGYKQVIAGAMRNPGATATVEARMRHRGGTWRYVEATVQSLLGDPSVGGVVISSRDVTGRRMAERDLARLASFPELNPSPVVELDFFGEPTYVNPAAQRLFPDLLAAGLDHPLLAGVEAVGLLRSEERVLVDEVRVDRDCYQRMVSFVPGEDLVRVYGMDVTERKSLEEELAHQALHDSLTGLPNRALFSDRLEHALARKSRDGGSTTVLLMDLDEFKTVNDSLGHPIGDRLLVEVTRRLLDCVRPEDTVARLSGDEFALLIEGLPALETEALIVSRVLETLRKPFDLHGMEVFVHGSVGIVEGSPGERAEDVLRNADVAMYSAKGRGKDRYEFYDPGMHAAALERLELRADLRRAVKRGEFVVHYQPIMALGADEIGGFEALARWEHPDKGLVSPAEFIPLAEETGLIVEIGLLVLEEACRQVLEWQASRPGGEFLDLSVNLSARQFRQPDLIEQISGVLDRTGFDANRLKLEVTESTAMEEVEMALVTLRNLRDLGIRLSIDDFGTGYSSLSYLRRFPVDDLKIDRSFVGRLDDDAESAAIVSTTVSLARILNLTVTAEGVETVDQLARLRGLGCDFAQGFHLARPLTAEAASSFIASHAGLHR